MQQRFRMHILFWAKFLLGQILLTGGIPGKEDDDPLEQVALVLEILSFHGGECK